MIRQMKSNVVAVAMAAAWFTAISLSTMTVGAVEEDRREKRFVPADYGIEVEPHFAFGPANVYGDTGVGGGVRLGIPLLVGKFGRVSDNLALSFGGDAIHYDNCYYGSHCGANYLMFPVAGQFNLFLGHRVSLFGEAGAFIYKGYFDACLPGDAGCSAPRDFGVLPTLALGGRIHLSDGLALTARVGYPTVTLGLSFM